jgi:phospholipid/cholesterol/gamma-HCH transport system substrate-binding protein
VKAFTERSPRAIGTAVLIVTALAVLAVIFCNRSLFESGYQVSARFPNAAGIGKGTEVLLAGVPVGSVGSVAIDGNAVDAVMSIDRGVVLPRHTAAAVEVETLLGVVDVTLQPVSGWSHPLQPGATITDTSVPTEFYQLNNTAGHLLEHADARAFNSVVQSLAAITRGKQAQVAAIIHGLGALTTTVDQRSSQVSQLIDSANTLSATLATRDQQLGSVIDDLNTVASGLADHSVDLADLIDNVDAMAGQTDSLLSQDRPQLDTLLQSLHATLGVVGQHQDDLAQVVSYLASALKGFSSVGYSGPDDTPNSWANIYANALGITGTAGALAPCGSLDQALDQILGPTPLACDRQTGPLPGATTSAAPPATSAPAAAGPGAEASGATGGPDTGAASPATASAVPGTGALAGALPSGPNSGVGGLSQLLTPLAGGAG